MRPFSQRTFVPPTASPAGIPAVDPFRALEAAIEDALKANPKLKISQTQHGFYVDGCEIRLIQKEHYYEFTPALKEEMPAAALPIVQEFYKQFDKISHK